MMNVSLQQGPRPRRLRDYGAFQTDISTLDTLHEVAVEKKSNGAILPVREYSYDTVFPASVLTALRQRSSLQVQSGRNTPRLRKMLKQKGFRLVMRLSITAALLAYLFKSVSWQTMLEALVHARLSGILVGLVVGSGGVVLSAYQWWGLLRAESIRFDLADLIKLYVVGITFNHFLPTGMGGDTFKAFYVGRESHNGIGAAGAAIMCRVTGFVGMLLLVFPVLFILHTRFTFTLILEFILLCLLVGIIVVGTLLLTLMVPAMSKSRWIQNRPIALLIGFGSALHKSLFRPRSMLGATIGGAVFWLIAVLNCYVYADALGIRGHLDFYFLAVPLVAIVACLPITINGFGVREGIFVYVFSFVHVTPTTALLLVFLLDLQSLFFAVIGCCIYFTSANRAKVVSL